MNAPTAIPSESSRGVELCYARSNAPRSMHRKELIRFAHTRTQVYGLALSLVMGLLGGCRCDARHSSTDLTVYAASSLTEVFGELERAFEAGNEDADVSLAFGGSQVLRLQIEQGAPADVFASANTSHMDALIEAGLVASSDVFAHNDLVVVVPLDNPAKIESFADLPRASRVVVGVPAVPIGAYAREALQHAAESFGADFRSDVLSHVVSEESNVRLIRAKVELGEADAAIVYRTDVTPSSRVRVIPIPAVLNVRGDYHIGVIERSPHEALARRWVAFLESTEGRRILSEHGFSTP